MLVSFVIPCFNERDALPPLFAELARLPRLLAPADFPEVIFVDDGSTDGSPELLYDFADSVHFPVKILGLDANVGVGAVLREAVAHIAGDAVVTYDADRAYPLTDVPAMLAKLGEGAAVVTASPWMAAGTAVGVPSARLALSRLASFAWRVRLLGRGQGIHTFTCGFRAWTTAAYTACLPNEDRFPATAEMLLNALRQRRRVVEVPATLRVRTEGVSKMRLARTVFRHLRLLVFGPRVRPVK